MYTFATDKEIGMEERKVLVECAMKKGIDDPGQVVETRTGKLAKDDQKIDGVQKQRKHTFHSQTRLQRQKRITVKKGDVLVKGFGWSVGAHDIPMKTRHTRHGHLLLLLLLLLLVLLVQWWLTPSTDTETFVGTSLLHALHHACVDMLKQYTPKHSIIKRIHQKVRLAMLHLLHGESASVVKCRVKKDTQLVVVFGVCSHCIK